MEGWKRVLRLRGSSSWPYVQVDEAAVTATWTDDGGGGGCGGKKKMVKLRLDGQVFEVCSTDDVPVPPEEAAGSKVRFKSTDGVEFEVDWAAARKSPTIKSLVQSSRLTAGSSGGVPIRIVVEVESKILEKVLEYCYKHVLPRTAAANAEVLAEELKRWDADFVKVDLDTLYHLIKAARYLKIDGLEDLACWAVAEIIEGKTPEEIRATFNIKKDMSPEEEEVAVRELHACQPATLENKKLIREEARRDWMDIVNSKFCTYYMLDF